MVLRRHIDLSVDRPPGLNWRRRARWIDQIRRDSSSSPVELWKHAIRCVALLLERCPRRLRDIDDDDDKPLSQQPTITGLSLAVCKCDALIYYRNIFWGVWMTTHNFKGFRSPQKGSSLGIFQPNWQNYKIAISPAGKVGLTPNFDRVIEPHS